MLRTRMVEALNVDLLEDAVNEALKELEAAKHIPRKIKIAAAPMGPFACIVYQPKHEGVVE